MVEYAGQIFYDQIIGDTGGPRKRIAGGYRSGRLLDCLHGMKPSFVPQLAERYDMFLGLATLIDHKSPEERISLLQLS